MQSQNDQLHTNDSEIILPLFLSDVRVRKSVWQSLTSASAGRGSTYTFVSAGNADVSSLESQHSRDDVLIGNNSPPSLRHLLRPLHSTATDMIVAPNTIHLPRTIQLDSPRDPREAGLVSSARALHLLDYFDTHLAPWLAAIDPLFDVQCSAFLLSAMLYQASKFCNEEIDERMALGSHTRMLAMLSFAEADVSMEAVLAVYLLAAWKDPDDQFSDLYTGYADRIGMKQNSKNNRHYERIHFFHYVQQSVFLLHYRPSPHIGKRDDFIRSALPWSLHPNALVGDWFLCADVESTAIQCRYKMLFEEQIQQYPSIGGDILSHSLLDAFIHEIQEWEHRWEREAQKGEKHRDHQLRMAGFRLFRNSVCTQISSIALRQALQSWLKGAQNQSTTSLAQVKRSYEICLDSAVGVLDSSLDLQDRPDLLLHMPDSLVILLDQASLLLVYLLLVPAITPTTQVKSTTNSFDEIKTISEMAAAECILRIKKVDYLLKTASNTRSASLVTATRLSSDYLASLVDLVEGKRVVNGEDRMQNLLTSSVIASPAFDDSFQGWDWLQYFLESSTQAHFQ